MTRRTAQQVEVAALGVEAGEGVVVEVAVEEDLVVAEEDLVVAEEDLVAAEEAVVEEEAAAAVVEEEEAAVEEGVVLCHRPLLMEPSHAPVEGL